MVNISHPELAETKVQPLPPASLDALKQMRSEMCSTVSSRDFKLQPNQRFLRRVLSPDSPTRNLLMVHGTGQGKTCTAIQIAEEYIVRPEFQDKKVLVLANPSIQENFKSQIFDISRVSVDADGLLLSKQCTGRKYLEMIQRSQAEPLRYTDKVSQQKVMNLANKLIGEFYEFIGYTTFAYLIDRKKLETKSNNEFVQWIHDTFDNRLIIIDEAHNLKETTETETSKLVAIALELILKTANGITLVLLTATPMYDGFDEILYYLNLFLWNDRRIPFDKRIKTSEIFTESGEFKEGAEENFRLWCQEYISYVKGENPFTFPFRLPPPTELIATPDRTTDINGTAITTQRKFLTLTKSIVSKHQADAIKDIGVKAVIDTRLVCAYPNNASFRESFDKSGGSFKYKSGIDKFLAPSKVAEYSSKFGLIMNIINSTTGLVFVYSNIVEGGAQLFAMCLEEHGFESAISKQLLTDTSGEVSRGSRGKYVLFTSDISDSEIKKALLRLKRQENVDGSDIRIVIASPKVSEGVDFRFIRQVHILDPWFNMSRIEQVIGRGMRTCSHSILPFEQQNCTVYLHVCRYAESTQETVDEYIYRTFVETKAIKIAKVKRYIMESAMDCSLQQNINNLPADWRGEPNTNGQRFVIPQIPIQTPTKEVKLTLTEMSAPTFEDRTTEFICKTGSVVEDPDHERPLSSILDAKDEIFDKILKLFAKKPIWSKADLFGHSSLKQYSTDTLLYLVQMMIDSRFELKDTRGRIGHLESRDGVFMFTIGEHETLLDKLIKQERGITVVLPTYEKAEAKIEEPEGKAEDGFSDLSHKRDAHPFPDYIKETFSPEILDWYIADNVLKPDEKIQHMLRINWSSPPAYAAPLVTTNASGKRLYILGSKQIYNEAREKITPIGEDEDAYRSWLKTAKDTFVSKKLDLFASMKEDSIVFNVDEKSVDIKRANRSKVIGGRTCTTYTEPVLNAFARWLTDAPFPEKVKTKKDRCMYLDLLIRQAVKSGKQGIFWVTPEELAVFSEDDNRSDLLKRLKD